MSYRLKDRTRKPPRPGFSWIDPATTQLVEGPNYMTWRTNIIEVCVANGSEIATEDEVEDQLCGRFDAESRKEYCDCVDGDEVRPILGVGSILKGLFAKIGIHSCWSCVDWAKRMDAWGPDGCEANMAQIVSAIEENASKRNWARFIPFREQGAELMVRIAIRKVREQSP